MMATRPSILANDSELATERPRIWMRTRMRCAAVRDRADGTRLRCVGIALIVTGRDPASLNLPRVAVAGAGWTLMPAVSVVHGCSVPVCNVQDDFTLEGSVLDGRCMAYTKHRTLSY